MNEYLPYRKMHSLRNFTSLDNVFYENRCSCIYVIRNISNDKLYIGKTVDYRDRYHDHKCSLKRGLHNNKQLLGSFNRGDNLEMSILEVCNIDQLDEREILWIAFFKSNDYQFGYNKTKGGNDRLPRSTESKIKWRKSRLGMSIDNTSHYIPILCYSSITGEFIKEYNSLKSAAIELSICQHDISSICRGRNKSAKIYTFRYKNIDNYPLNIGLTSGKIWINKINNDTGIIEELLSLKQTATNLELTYNYISKIFKKNISIFKNNYEYKKI